MASPTLNIQTVQNLQATLISVPQQNIFNLPEKVLQFGTGVLLRGLPDYYIDKANKQGIFNGRIVVVKSTDSGAKDEFAAQNNLYTHCIKGVVNGNLVQQTIVNASISRVLAANNAWENILDTATNPNMQLVLSNTTELGIILQENDSIHNTPPTSFPGKLLAWLYKRYQTFNGSIESGVTIVPTELITDNATKLKSIVVTLAQNNQLDKNFIQWLNTANDFCNSLVDRIVPGKMPVEQHQATEAELGYKDELMIMSEEYSLWAIESTSNKTKQILSFAQVNPQIVIANNIDGFREIKLRLLNGTHTFSCAIAYLAGFNTVKEAMQNPLFNSYVNSLMAQNIIPCITGTNISQQQATTFAASVIDRFANPYLNHLWLSISMNFSGKMKMRNLHLIQEYYARYNEVPEYMAMGFAAYILFMKPINCTNDKFYGSLNEQQYLINDELAIQFQQAWQMQNINSVVHHVLSNQQLWQANLTQLSGFENAVSNYVTQFLQQPIINVISQKTSLQQVVA